MSCLAVALQPLNGPDVLLQTREWFPPARASYASSSFRSIRAAYSAGKQITSDSVDTSLGDEALSASSGQVVVGSENKFRVVYRLVNSIYVLGIANTDQDEALSNIFECANIVNQAVSVLVAACKGIDVTADKLARKYTEIYMALDVVLHGVSTARLGIILSTIHGDNVAQILLSAADAENRARGADSWKQVKGTSIEHCANVEVLSSTSFELPEETIAAGDKVISALVPQAQASSNQDKQQPVEKAPANEDPFAASEAINKPQELAGGFQKSKDTPSDVTAALAELVVPPIALGTAESTFVGVEGFEGDYGGLDVGDGEDDGFGDAFDSLTGAFGGGLDVSDYAADKVTPASELTGLEELEGKGVSTAKKSSVEVEKKTDAINELFSSGSPEGAPKKEEEKKGPLLWLVEEIHAEFKGLVISRAGLQGSLQLRTENPSLSGKSETEFSFALEGAAGVKRGAIQSSIASSLGEGCFHVKTSHEDSPQTVMKYHLQPRFTPLPIRLRLVTRQVGFILSVMVQYVVNPYLPGVLKDVTFILCLPCTPASFKMSPRGIWDKSVKEVRWHIQELTQKDPPGRLRVQFPLETKDNVIGSNGNTKDEGVKARVEFTCKDQTLSGITVRPTHEGNTDFHIGEHMFKAGSYVCSV